MVRDWRGMDQGGGISAAARLDSVCRCEEEREGEEREEWSFPLWLTLGRWRLMAIVSPVA